MRMVKTPGVWEFEPLQEGIDYAYVNISKKEENKIDADNYVFCKKCETNPCECENKIDWESDQVDEVDKWFEKEKKKIRKDLIEEISKVCDKHIEYWGTSYSPMKNLVDKIKKIR